MHLLFHSFLAVHLPHEGIEAFHVINDSPSLRKNRPIRHIVAAIVASKAKSVVPFTAYATKCLPVSLQIKAG